MLVLNTSPSGRGSGELVHWSLTIASGRPDLTPVAFNVVQDRGAWGREVQVRYAIQSSSNFLDWVTFLSLTVTNNFTPVIDPEITPQQKRFYQAVYLP